MRLRVRIGCCLASWAGKFESETYEDAYHGWRVPGGAVYNQA